MIPQDQQDKEAKQIQLGDLPRLVTVKTAAEYLGLSQSQVRALVAANRIAHTSIGARIMIPREALDDFIRQNTVQPCHGEIQDPVSAFSKSVNVSISSGLKADAVESAQRLLRIADSLKQHSPNSSISATGAQVRANRQKSS